MINSTFHMGFIIWPFFIFLTGFISLLIYFKFLYQGDLQLHLVISFFPPLITVPLRVTRTLYLSNLISERLGRGECP